MLEYDHPFMITKGALELLAAIGADSLRAGLTADSVSFGRRAPVRFAAHRGARNHVAAAPVVHVLYRHVQRHRMGLVASELCCCRSVPRLVPTYFTMLSWPGSP